MERGKLGNCTSNIPEVNFPLRKIIIGSDVMGSE